MFEKYQTNSMAGMECAGKTGDKVKVEMKQIFQGLIGHIVGRRECGLVSGVVCLCWPEDEKNAPA